MSQAQLDRRIRFLSVYSGVLTLVLCVTLLTAFSEGRVRFEEIDVERINVVRSDGSLALVIANPDRYPGAIFGGTEYPEHLSAGRAATAGLLFFNGLGDEVGGLGWRQSETDSSYTAGAGLTFDQHQQDQVVQVFYNDRGSSRAAGLEVWDRSTDYTVSDLLDVAMEVRSEDPTVADAAVARYREMQAANGLGARRVFVGSDNRTAEVRLRDTAGRSRIRMYVDSLDVARLEFLDESGAVIYAVPDE